jgi:hypothetical protein
MNQLSECNGVSTGEFMIRSVEISHFKCFKKLKVDNVRRINVLVGDNGSGKTAFMEGIFLALGAGSELIGRYRQQRGIEGGTLMGTPQDIEEAIFSELFYDNDLTRTVMITVAGSGVENRSVRIDRGISPKAVEFFRRRNPNFIVPPSSYRPFTICWMDDQKEERFAIPQFTNQGMQWHQTGEIFPQFFYFAANQTLGPLEAASRFSRLSKSFSEYTFKEPILNEFNIVGDLSLELSGGTGIIHAAVPGLSNKVPVPNVSGAINRLVTVLISMAAVPDSVLFIDEMENGVYYKHQKEMWRAVLKSARDNRCQIITSTHSLEWVRALVEAADGNLGDICLWRFERGQDGSPELFPFDGEMLGSGIEFGSDPRGSAE